MSAGVVAALRRDAVPFDETPAGCDELFDLVRDARFVLLGEATHGTKEFYEARADVTKRLIDEEGFDAVAVEADWPDAYRANCYVRGATKDVDAVQALEGFKRFPTWMWRNAAVVDFLEWLRTRNQSLPPGDRTGFYGLDLYSLFGSIEAVVDYLHKVDPEAARRARKRYGGFHRFEGESRTYGIAAAYGEAGPCEQEVVAQLGELQKNATRYARATDSSPKTNAFFAEQNARLVRNAERCYWAMFWGRVESWNLRDQHMVEMLDAVAGHLTRSGRPARVVVWEHNSHIGDARATGMGRSGEWNVGQLVRESRVDRTALR